MKNNVVLAERTIRIGAGMLLLSSPLLELPTYPFNLLGLLLVGTALVGYCPLYSLLSAPRANPDARRANHEPIHGSASKA